MSAETDMALMVSFAVVALLLPPAGTQRPTPADAGLKIVVIEGEGAVNIIQQKTAVAPVVEVRDRNDLPVPGAVVTFSVGGNSASFAGAQTISITTNAAGRAAAASFSPLTSGSVQIQVSAAFQGQTAAATIAQTNVMTAAQAAGAAGATTGSGAGGGSGGAGAGAAGGGGGGISGTTIGIVGAAVGGGALAATQLDGVLGGDDNIRTNFTGPLSGQFQVTTTSSGFNPVCVSTRAITGTFNIRLVEEPGGSVRGDLVIEGTQSEVARSCPSGGSGFPTTPIRYNGNISGTASNFTWSFSNTASSTGATSTNVVIEVSFTGALSGGVITGTLTYSETANGQNEGGAFGGKGTGTFPVTLRPGA
jgi:hypothetical protein